MQQNEPAATRLWVLPAMLVVLMLVVGACAVFAGNSAATQTVRNEPVSHVARLVAEGRVQRLVVRGDVLEAHLGEDQLVRAHLEEGVSVGQMLRDHGIAEEPLQGLTLEVEPTADWGWASSLLWLLPLLLIGGFIFFSRKAGQGGQGEQGQAFQFARSRARQITGTHQSVRFADVAGIDEAKEDLQEVVEFLKQPARFSALGARIPKGVLLVGPPGTGKTLVARAIAGEAGVPFFYQSASEFVELFVGVGASRVRDLFKQAKENAPSIIFLDEIDAIGRRRGAGMGQSHEEREQTLNQILTELDGFDPRSNVVVLAASNRPDVLDPALLRPGRFDRRIRLDSPDLESRLAILRVHARGKPLAPEVDLQKLARLTPGFSGADLENLLNEAALLTARRHGQTIGMAELEEAIDRVMLGPQRRGRRFSPREAELTATHESGHALVAHLLPNAPPVHKISIVSRGQAGGHTRVLDEQERHYWSREELEETLAYMLGGMAAEKLIYGQPSTGPGSDLGQATRTARKMVLEYGMSEKIGPVAFGQEGESEHWPTEARREFSERTAAVVDAEVRELVSQALDRAERVLEQHRPRLEELARQLRERETLQGPDLEQALGPSLRAA